MSREQIKIYQEKGYVFLEEKIESDFVISNIIKSSKIVKESDKKHIRSIYGFQSSKYLNDWLSIQKPIKNFVKELLGDEVYLHQAKLNFKNNDVDSIWQFHRDFPFWHNFDNIANNEMVNIFVFLDDVLEKSTSERVGELLIIPSSHKSLLERETKNKDVEVSIDGSYSKDLAFAFTDEEISQFIQKLGLFKAFNTKGSILAFDPDVIHGSNSSNENLSRKILILTFNKCSNKPVRPSKRPEYLCSTKFKPIEWKV